MNDLCVSLVAPDGSSDGYVFDLVILGPDVIFLAFLAVRARRCYDILCRNPSVIMWTYYCLVWAVSIINTGRTLLQIIGGTAVGHHHGELWTALWLVTRFVMVMLEVSVIVFLLHGYVSSSAVALRQTAIISAAIAVADSILKAVLIWSFDVSLYLLAAPGGGLSTTGSVTTDMASRKWGFWLAHSLCFALAYLGLMLLPCTPWRALLPAKDTFHYYVRALFAVNVVAVLGAALIGHAVGAGYCLYGGAQAAYFAGYAPLLYATFLASFFTADDVDLETYYYSEMSEAGFLDNPSDDPFVSLVP